MPRKAYYYMRLRNDNFITELCVAGASDPDQFVETDAPDGTVQRWKKYQEGDLLIFRAPDGYSGGPIGWCYDRRIQDGERMPEKELRHRAIGCAVSAGFDLGKPGIIGAN